MSLANNHQLKVDINWSLYDSDVRVLADQIRRWPGFLELEHVLGIPRGGMVLAVHLSHLLDLRYEHSKIGLDPKKTLLVDDVSDSGKTLWHYKQFGFVVVTLYMKPGTRLVPKFYVREYSRETWLNFPWEV